MAIVTFEQVANYAKTNMVSFKDAVEYFKSNGAEFSPEDQEKLSSLGGKTDLPQDAGEYAYVKNVSVNGEQIKVALKNGLEEGALVESGSEKTSDFMKRNKISKLSVTLDNGDYWLTATNSKGENANIALLGTAPKTYATIKQGDYPKEIKSLIDKFGIKKVLPFVDMASALDNQRSIKAECEKWLAEYDNYKKEHPDVYVPGYDNVVKQRQNAIDQIKELVVARNLIEDGNKAEATARLVKYVMTADMEFVDPTNQTNQASSGKNVQKILSMAVALVAVGLLVTSCGEKIEQDATFNLDLENKATASAIDQLREEVGKKLDDILAAVLKNNELTSEQTTVIKNQFGMIKTQLETTNALLKEGNATAADIGTCMENVYNELKTITKNQDLQINIESDIYGSVNDFMAFIEKLAKDRTKWDEEHFKQLMEHLKLISSIGASIDAKLKKSLDNDEKVISALQKLDNNDQKTNALLQLIYEAIKKLDDDVNAIPDRIRNEFKQYFKDIIAQIAVNGDKMTDLTKLLKTIDQHIVDNTDAQNENTLAILAKLDELGFKVVNGAADIVEEVRKGNLKLDVVIGLLDKIKAIAANTNIKVGDIYALGENMFKAITNLGGNIGTKLNQILDEIKKNTAVSQSMAGLLNVVISNQASAMQNNKEGFKAVIDAIHDITVNGADTSKIENLLDQLVALTKQNGVKIDLNTQQLKDLADKLGVFDANVQAKLQVIIDSGKVNLDKILEFLAKIEKNGNETNVKLGDMNVKADAMINGMKEILDAIKNGFKNIEVKIEDHDVKVTVDVTGKVECKCTCDGHSPNEGIITELNNLFG